jgi:hypothetical protein
MTRPRLPLPVIGVVLPAIVYVAGVIIAAVALPSGDRIAVHWDFDGTPNGFAPPWVFLVGMAVLALALSLTFGLILFASEGDGATATRRFLAVVALWLAVFLTALTGWTLFTQREGVAAVPIWQGLLIAFGAALVAAGLAAVFTPPSVSVPPTAHAADPLPLAPAERAVWVGRTRLATPGLVAILLGVVIALGAAIVANIAAAGALAPLFLVPAVLVVMVLFTSFWTVRVDDAGMEVRSATGWPRFRVPAAQVASAGTIDVRPLGEFGGWGIRFGRGRRLGIVMRSGEALEVQNRDGGALVVTVDDAHTAAALLSAVAARAATRPPARE